jgi:general secretion pathway protein K
MCLKRGSALLSALFMMTLIAITATAMTTRLQRDIYKTRLLIESDTLSLASDAVTNWAIEALKSTKTTYVARDNSGTLLTFPKETAQMYPHVKLEGTLVDLQARLNINNLEDRAYRVIFYGLLEKTMPQIKALTRQAILEAIKTWISPADPGMGDIATVNNYLHQNPPYWPAHQWMLSTSELEMVTGITHAMFYKLEPYLTALPEVTSINVNTASTQLLQALGDGLKPAEASIIEKARGTDGMVDFQPIQSLITTRHIPIKTITTTSHYFLCIASASTTDMQFIRYTLLKRTEDKTNTGWDISILQDSINTPI